MEFITLYVTFFSNGNLSSCSLSSVFLALSGKLHLSAAPNRKMGVFGISVQRFRPSDGDASFEVLPSHACVWTLGAPSLPKAEQSSAGTATPVTQAPQGTFSYTSFYRDGMYFRGFFLLSFSNLYDEQVQRPPQAKDIAANKRNQESHTLIKLVVLTVPRTLLPAMLMWGFSSTSLQTPY